MVLREKFRIYKKLLFTKNLKLCVLKSLKLLQTKTFKIGFTLLFIKTFPKVLNSQILGITLSGELNLKYKCVLRDKFWVYKILLATKNT